MKRCPRSARCLCDCHREGMPTVISRGVMRKPAYLVMPDRIPTAKPTLASIRALVLIRHGQVQSGCSRWVGSRLCEPV
jgi:hypothetical protein